MKNVNSKLSSGALDTSVLTLFEHFNSNILLICKFLKVPSVRDHQHYWSKIRKQTVYYWS